MISFPLNDYIMISVKKVVLNPKIYRGVQILILICNNPPTPQEDSFNHKITYYVLTHNAFEELSAIVGLLILS